MHVPPVVDDPVDEALRLLEVEDPDIEEWLLLSVLDFEELDVFDEVLLCEADEVWLQELDVVV